MAAKIIPYGGVGEIGGNKIKIEDKKSNIMLDFGLSYSKYNKYYTNFLQPRVFTGLGDVFAPDIIPDLEGIYRNDLREIAGLKKEDKVLLDGVLLSHAHSDHANHIYYLHPEIPIYCGRLTYALLSALEDMGGGGIVRYRKRTPITASWKKRPIIERKFKLIEDSKPFKIKDLEIIPYTIDHSIPGSTGFLINTSSGWVVYTGDIRFHGERGDASYRFIKEAKKCKPTLLITEGTNIEDESNFSEASVYEQAERVLKVAKDERSLLMVTFSARDLDRLNTFYRLAKENGRILAITLSQAYILRTIYLETSVKERKLFSYIVPEIKSKDIALYLDRKVTGTYDEKDYSKWARKFLSNSGYQIVKADDINRNQHKYILVLNFFDLQELNDLNPKAPSFYIHSSSTPFNKPLEIEDTTLKNWLALYGIKYYQIHASGHAACPYLQEMAETLKPESLFPIHTEKPELFKQFSAESIMVEEGKEYRL